MLRFEWLRILRNPKWKYLILLLLGTFAYAITLMNDSSLNMKYMLRMGTAETIQSICLFPVVLLCFLLYHIAEEAEHQNTWKTLLSCPIAQGKRIGAKLCILIGFQIPILCIPVFLCYMISGAIDMQLLIFSWCMQIIYLTSFMYYTFAIASGYLNATGSVNIINVLKISTPIFLFFCITNIKDWMYVYSGLWKLLTVCFLVLIMILVLCNRMLMHRKLYREMILYRLFGVVATYQAEQMKNTYRTFTDKLLQAVFHMYRGKSETYWKTCAAVEVAIKQSGYYLLVTGVCLWIWVQSEWFLFLALAMTATIYFIYSCINERKRIHRVRILPSGKQ